MIHFFKKIDCCFRKIFFLFFLSEDKNFFINEKGEWQTEKIEIRFTCTGMEVTVDKMKKYPFFKNNVYAKGQPVEATFRGSIK